MRGLPIIVAMILTTLLAGCSAIRLGYTQSPTLLYYWLDGYADFDSSQADRVKENLQALHTWHRSEELPLLAEELSRLQTLALQDTTPEQLCSRYEFVNERLRAPLLRAAADAAPIASSLRASQLKTLQAALQKRNTQWKEEWQDLSPEKLLDKRSQQWVKRLEDFYGSLSSSQEALVRSALERSGWDPAAQHRETLRRQQDTLAVLAQLQETRPAPAQAEQALRELLLRSLQSPVASHQRYQARLQQSACTLLATLHNSTSPSQRAQLAKTLAAYERDARALVRQPGA